MGDTHNTTNSTVAKITLLLLLILALGILPSVSASEAYVTVSDVEVSDDEPEIGDKVYITPTISVSDEAENGVEIEKVYVRNGNDVHDEVRSLGMLGAGDSVEAPMMAKFEESGIVTARIRVVGNINGDRHDGFYVKYPVHIGVKEPSSSEPATPPRLSLNTGAEPLESGDEVRVSVSNADDSRLKDLRLTLEGPGVGTERRVYPQIGAYEMRKFNFTLGENVDSSELTATLRTEDFEVTTSETFELPESGESGVGSGDTEASTEDTVEDAEEAETVSEPSSEPSESEGTAPVVGGGLLAIASVAGLLWRRKWA